MDNPEFEAFKRKVWRLERIAAKSGGFMKIIPSSPNLLKAYAAKLYRAVSRMSFVDMPNVVPGPGEVCAFTAISWAQMPLWDVWSTLEHCKGRITLAVVIGESFRVEQSHTLVLNPVEVARL